jgi:hypothetical protein
MKGKSLKPRCSVRGCRHLAVCEISTPEIRLTVRNGEPVKEWASYHYCAKCANQFLYGSEVTQYKNYKDGYGVITYRIFFLD